MRFLFQKRRAFVRTSTHTVVRDADPDFGAFCGSEEGIVATLLRIWIDAPRGKGRRRGGEEYLGSLRFSPGCPPSPSEMRRLLTRLSRTASRRGLPARTLRRELFARLREELSPARGAS